MEAIYKLLSEYLKSIFTILKIILRSSLFIRTNKATNKRPLYILGNGPSFKTDFKTYNNKLSTANLLSVNGFPLTSAFEELKPTYFIVCSPGYYNNIAVDYNVSLRAKIIESLIEKTTWPLTFFIPIAAKKNKLFIEKVSKNKNITFSYFNTTPIEGAYPISKLLLSKGLGSPRPHNVLIPSILQGINSGFSKIYLLGADHSWLPQISVNSQNQVLINQKHFYDEEQATPKQMHKNEGQANRQLHEVLQKFYYSFRSYHLLNRYANDKGCTIINLTKDSYIDAFIKENLTDHFNK